MNDFYTDLHGAQSSWHPGLEVFSSGEDHSSLDDDNSVIQMVFNHYHQTLFSNVRAQSFLRTIGLDDDNILRNQMLGFSDRTLGLSLPGYRSMEGHTVRGELQINGILKASGHERLRGALVVPIRDRSGLVCAAYGRLINAKQRQGVARHIYWCSKANDLYQPMNLIQGCIAILCQNPLDALIFKAAGFDEAVAILGPSQFNERHVKALSNQKITQVILAFDESKESRRSTGLIAQALSYEGVRCQRVIFPLGQDLCQYIARQSSKAESLAMLLRNAQPFSQTYDNVVGSLGYAIR